MSALALALGSGGTASAQTKPKAPVSAAPQANPPASSAQSPQANRTSVDLLVPNTNGLAILIDNAIVALSQANVTGNYGVLHDLGSPDFQKLNSPQHLADVFAGLRERSLNMTPLVLYQPRLSAPADNRRKRDVADQPAFTTRIRFKFISMWRFRRSKAPGDCTKSPSGLRSLNEAG